jgi:hypothetical protein
MSAQTPLPPRSPEYDDTTEGDPIAPYDFQGRTQHHHIPDPNVTVSDPSCVLL